MAHFMITEESLNQLRRVSELVDTMLCITGGVDSDTIHIPVGSLTGTFAIILDHLKEIQDAAVFSPKDALEK